jgi:hypothetical protein
MPFTLAPAFVDPEVLGRRGFLICGRAHRLEELTYRPLAPDYQARLDAMIEGTEKPSCSNAPGASSQSAAVSSGAPSVLCG